MYFVAFLIMQLAANAVMLLIFKDPASDATRLVTASITGSFAVIFLFAWRKWSPLTRRYLNSRPWDTLTWVALCSVGMIVISSFIGDMAGIRMSDDYIALFTKIMNHRFGYIAIGIVAPVAEEMVFRGAIQRTLHNLCGDRMHWLPIFITALLFGIAHNNMAQALNATLLGLLIGWMYYRTGSIIPGIVFHWMNNTIAYVLFRLMPGTADMTITELCGGDIKTMAFYLLCSLCMAIPSIYQLSFRMKRP